MKRMRCMISCCEYPMSSSLSPAWSGRPERCEYMSPTVTVRVTYGSASANHGSDSTIGISHVTVLSVTAAATTVDPTDFDTDASWKTVFGSTASPVVMSLTPNPLAYLVSPPDTTATATPGILVDSIIELTRSSSCPTALSTASAGSGSAATAFGFCRDSDADGGAPVPDDPLSQAATSATTATTEQVAIERRAHRDVRGGSWPGQRAGTEWAVAMGVSSTSLRHDTPRGQPVVGVLPAPTP